MRSRQDHPNGGMHGYANAIYSPSPALARKATSSPVHDVRKILSQSSNNPMLNSHLGSDALYPSYTGSQEGYWQQQQQSQGSPRGARTLPRNCSTPQYANTQTLYSPYFQGGSPSAAAGIAGSAMGAVVVTNHVGYSDGGPPGLGGGGRGYDAASGQREYYPSDYGLPLEPLPEDNELLASPHGAPAGGGVNMALNPLNNSGYFNPETGSDILEPIHPHPLPHQQHLMHNMSNSSAESSTLSPMRTSGGGMTMSSGIGDASTASGTTTTIIL